MIKIAVVCNTLRSFRWFLKDNNFTVNQCTMVDSIDKCKGVYFSKVETYGPYDDNVYIAALRRVK